MQQSKLRALLFSLSFWTASSLVHDNRVRNSLLMSSIGMAFLFGSIEIASLQYHVYPPFALITEAFIPIGAYLLFVGIFISAKGVSQDADLRRAFYKKAESQLSLLRAIGVSEMEKELLKQVKSLENKHEREISDLNHLMGEEENAKEIIREVLNELYYSKRGNRGIQG